MRRTWIGLVTAVALVVTAGTAAAAPVSTPVIAADELAAANETLTTAVETGDVATVRTTLAELSPLLTALAAERSVAEETRDLAAAAGEELTAAAAELSARDLPPVTEMLSLLLQRLLILLAELVYNLLGPPPVLIPIP